MKKTLLMLQIMMLGLSCSADVLGTELAAVNTPAEVIENPYAVYLSWLYRGNAMKVIDDVLYIATEDGIYSLETGTLQDEEKWVCAAFKGHPIYEFVKSGTEFIGVKCVDGVSQVLRHNTITHETSLVMENSPEHVRGLTRGSDPSKIYLLGEAKDGERTDDTVVQLWQSDDFGKSWSSGKINGTHRLFVSPIENYVVTTELPYNAIFDTTFMYLYNSDGNHSTYEVEGLDADIVFVPGNKRERIVVNLSNKLHSSSELMISNDGGTSFENVKINDGYNHLLVHLATDSKHPSVIYALDAGGDGRLFLSPSIFPSEYNNITPTRILRSSDGGYSWHCVAECNVRTQFTSGMVYYDGYMVFTMGDGTMSKIKLPEISSIDDVAYERQELEVTKDGDIMTVSGSSPASTVSVFNAGGQLMGMAHADSEGTALIRISGHNGVYFVKCGEKTVKITM